MFKKATGLLLLAVLFCATGVMAQNNLRVADPQQTWYSYQGTIEEATISVSPKGLFSQVSMYLTFSARGTNFSSSSQLEIVLNYELPEGSFVTDLWLWIGDEISKGVILDTWTASSIYEGIVNRRRDPAILFKKSSKDYELRVFPMAVNGTRKVRVTYMVPNSWLNAMVSIPLPLNVLNTSMNKIPVVNLITWKSPEWINPRVQDVTGTFAYKSDTFFGAHHVLSMPNYNNYSSLSLDFDNPMINGVYLKFYKKPDEGYYQLSLFPGTSLETVNKKVLFLIDYDSRKSTTDRKQIIDNIKLIATEYLNPGDQFNIFYSGLNIGKVSDEWVSAEQSKIDDAFLKINQNSISVYSNLPTLLREGYDFSIEKGGNSFVYLISNSDQVGSYQSANQLIADIRNLLTTNIPTFILDYNDREYMYYYFSNRSYIGNEYFYENLARMTGGVYSRLFGSFSNSIVDVYSKMGGTVNSFDLYTSLENGFCFSRQTLSGNNESAQLSKAITQVGKFIGDLPFIIKTSGIFNSTPFTQTKIIEDYDSRLTDDITEKMWVSSYINSLEKGTIDNSTISEIVSLSLSNRILSRYSAFLSVESDTAYCKDCYMDDGMPATAVEDEQPIPTEFSLEAYPNPFNSQVSITVKLPQNISAKNLSFKIYNILGQVVKTFMLEELQNSNVIKLRWDGKNDSGETVTSGVYVFMVSGKDFNHSLKLMFLK